jgi:hypothetical protein
MGGDSLLEFVSTEFSQRAQAVYDSLHVVELTIENLVCISYHVSIGFPTTYLLGNFDCVELAT